MIKYYELNGVIYSVDNKAAEDDLISKITPTELDLSDISTFYNEQYRVPITNDLISIRNAMANGRDLLDKTKAILLILPIK